MPPPRGEPDRLPERLARLPGLELLREAAADLPAYLVGGSVRDLLIGVERSDLDVAVEGDVAPLAERLGGDALAHERFGTAKVKLEGLEVDLAATRGESYAHPGALPDVFPATLADDLARRDFSVNAMAVPLAGESELIDPHAGLEDLRRGRLRVLHDGSFVDDPTRALRAARYAARYGFELEARTAELLAQTDLATVSEDRVLAELRRTAAEPEARQAFALLQAWGLLDFPEGAEERMAELERLVADPAWSAVADRTEAFLAAARGAGDARIRALAKATPERPSEAVAAARGASGTELLLARAAGAAWLDRYVSEWREVRLEIGGQDLLAAGVAEGPDVGRGLEEALRAKLDGEVRGREEELAVALRAAGARS